MPETSERRNRTRRGPMVASLSAAVLAAVLGWGTWRHPDFWLTTAQRGDRLMTAGDYQQAAATYTDPWHIGVAQYRNGDFEAAAHTFARVPGAVGVFDAGNAWLMHGKYDEAIAAYERALSFRPDWPAAKENQALARARKQRLDDSGRDRAQESAEAYKPDEMVFDQQRENSSSTDTPQNMNGDALSDAELRATWLRRVQTTPGDFLRAKFAYQASREDQPPASDPASRAP